MFQRRFQRNKGKYNSEIVKRKRTRHIVTLFFSCCDWREQRRKQLDFAHGNHICVQWKIHLICGIKSNSVRLLLFVLGNRSIDYYSLISHINSLCMFFISSLMISQSHIRIVITFQRLIIQTERRWLWRAFQRSIHSSFIATVLLSLSWPIGRQIILMNIQFVIDCYLSQFVCRDFTANTFKTAIKTLFPSKDSESIV